jgi:hypothetical protein
MTTLPAALCCTLQRNHGAGEPSIPITRLCVNFIPGMHEQQLVSAAQAVGLALAGDYFEEYVGQVTAMSHLLTCDPMQLQGSHFGPIGDQ